MSFILSILAIIVGLVAVYLAADMKQNVESKIRQHTETFMSATQKSINDCLNSIENLTDRIEKLEGNDTGIPEFKSQITSELGEINNKLTDLRQELLILGGKKSAPVPQSKPDAPDESANKS